MARESTAESFSPDNTGTQLFAESRDMNTPFTLGFMNALQLAASKR
jgi:hypothetical protein